MVTRKERAEATRLKLLEATAATLVEHGFAGTSTPRIVERAGVSQGALFKQFGSKTDLLIATTEHLFDGLLSGFREALGRAVERHPERSPLESGVHVLWEMFQTDRLRAVLELYVAARYDEALGEAIRPAIARHRANVKAAAAELFSRELDDEVLDAMIPGAIAMMNGAALIAPLSGDDSGAPEFLLRVARAVEEGRF